MKFIIRCVPCALKSQACNVGKILGRGKYYMKWGNPGDWDFSPFYFGSLIEADKFRTLQMGFPETAKAEELA